MIDSRIPALDDDDLAGTLVEPATPGRAPTATESRSVPSPRALLRAAELGINLGLLLGPGDPMPTTQLPSPNQAMRRAVTRRCSERGNPHYYLWHTLDLEPMLTRLDSENELSRLGEHVPAMAPMVRAVALALRDFPELGGGESGLHVGLALQLTDGGLVTPALYDADKRSNRELMAAIRDLTHRARTGNLRAAELSDARVGVISLGVRGVDGLVGAVHPPQTAMVGFGTIAKRPWVIGDQIVIRRVTEVSLSAGPRFSDGHHAARFLHTIQQRINEPDSV